MKSKKPKTPHTSKLLKQNIGFIGGGNMAQAMIGGLLVNGMPAEQIMVSDPVESIRDRLSESGILTVTNNKKLLKFADVVIIAIKPQLFAQVLTPLAGKLTDELVISVAAGMPIASIAALLKHQNIVRAMPNTPALIQSGATGLFASENVSPAHKKVAKKILSAAGLVVWVEDEEQLHAVTAVSGSAPAYFFYFMEAMISTGKALGLSAKQAKALTLQTALGAAQMAITSDDEPAELRRKVTSPNGTTQAALESMQANALNQKIAAAMQACVKRSKEMAKEIN